MTVRSSRALGVLKEAAPINARKREVLQGVREPVRSVPIRLARVARVEDDGLAVPVYDLTVEGAPEFVAGGLVVHNCPTWDLPAGSPVLGGSCAGATSAQTNVPIEKRRGLLDRATGYKTLRVHAPGGGVVPVREGFTTCQFCYASGGNYQYANTQAGELVRLWWTRYMLSQGAEGRREWVELVFRSLLAVLAPVEVHPMPDGSRRSIIPVRLHSSGDFYDPVYARAWVAVANRLAAYEEERRAAGDPLPGEYRIWAPTRTWAAPGWQDAWPGILEKLVKPNLVVRASSYHTNDPAPAGLTGPGLPGWAMGSTATWAADNARLQGNFDWDCPVYALKAGKKTCANARCRVCWVRPELRVNYTVH